ncbi:hypothetical protein COOONC_11367 [Cooperia oncophora]
MSDPDVLAFQCANNCLKNYRVVGVLPSLNAPKWVLTVEEKSSGKIFVMKLLEKGVRTSKSRVLLPTNVPHMVQLHQFFETETYIILVLDYVEGGRLWDFLIRYFSESERRFLFNLAESGVDMGYDVGEARTDSMDCYRGWKSLPYIIGVVEFWQFLGRWLHFSVGVDFERVAEMRDETHSNDVPSVSGVCTMGEDAMGTSRAPDGDFCVVENAGVENLSIHDEESPATVQLPRRYGDHKYDEAANQTLLNCISNVRLYLRRERRRTWPGNQPLPEPLIVHWTAQIVSWLYVMHNEHGEVICDLRPDNLLVDTDGNLQITYYGKWHNNGRPKEIVQGYSAPGEVTLRVPDQM